MPSVPQAVLDSNGFVWDGGKASTPRRYTCDRLSTRLIVRRRDSRRVARNRIPAGRRGTPITWSVAEPEVVSAINNLFMSRGISGINVVHVPVG